MSGNGISVWRRRASKLLLVLIALLFLVVPFYFFHDIYTLVAFSAATGVGLLGRTWKKWSVVGLFACLGLYWSSWDASGCSLWWRVSTIGSKAAGHQPYLGWSDVVDLAFSTEHCYLPEGKDRWVEDSIALVQEEQVDGHPMRQFDTQIGKLWAAEEGPGTMAWLLWEIAVFGAYERPERQISRHDVVIDCGAHVGVYTRYALNKGAARVVAIEPNPANIRCLERNFATEIEEGRVTLVKAGVWNERSNLELMLHSHVSARSTLLSKNWQQADKIVVPVLPLDDIVDELKLERVDVIKMDIEGAERWALEGAQKTIKRFRPRMAICTYHLADDPDVVPSLALQAHPGYEIHAKGISFDQGYIQPKVLLFN